MDDDKKPQSSMTTTQKAVLDYVREHPGVSPTKMTWDLTRTATNWREQDKMRGELGATMRVLLSNGNLKADASFGLLIPDEK